MVSTRCQSATATSSIGSRCCTPALLTKIEIGPTSSSIRSIAVSTAAASVTSKAYACTRSAPNSAARADRARCTRPLSSPFSTTVAPAPARPAAIELPIPRLEPVTNAIRPLRSKLGCTG